MNICLQEEAGNNETKARNKRDSHHDLGVELIEKGKGGVFATSEAGELVMPVSSHRQESVSSVHQVTLQRGTFLEFVSIEASAICCFHIMPAVRGEGESQTMIIAEDGD